MTPRPGITSNADNDPVSNASAPEPQQAEDRYSSPEVNWQWLVSRIRLGDDAAMTELYQIFARGIRFHLCRQLGSQELDDKVHDTFLIVVQAIRRGDLREPERLMGFVRTIVRRQVSAYIEDAIHRRREQAEIDCGVRLVDHGCTPEQTAMDQQRKELVASILNKMNGRDREILTRFYLQEQTQEQICEDMSLTETQFRLLKSRAKARFGEIGKKKLQRPLAGLFVRTSASGAH
jgi:RNA polymerase sigma-70 factor (ECF subfamily)